MLRKFNPEGVTPAPFYSYGVETSGPGRTLYISGQVGQRPDGSVAEGMRAQAEVAAANLQAVLAGAGMDLTDVAKMTIYLTDETQMGEFQAGAASLVVQPPAAVTLLVIKALASPALLVEIEAIAFKAEPAPG